MRRKAARFMARGTRAASLFIRGGDSAARLPHNAATRALWRRCYVYQLFETKPAAVIRSMCTLE